MTGRTQHKQGDVVGRWTLVELRKSSGNGDVWVAEGDEPRLVAIKILHRTSATDYARFRREVAIAEDLGSGEQGILPVIASHLPETLTRLDRPWLAMPLATDLTTAIAGATLDTKVAAVRDVARTLARLLAEHGIHHRDVKPANLFRYQDKVVVGDFGLAKRPSDEDLTAEKQVGPFLHLPTEVFVDDSEPDWERVDVYCLANTLWCLAVERLHPPRGQIRAGEDDSLALILVGEPHVVELASIIERATARRPSSRPSLEVLASELAAWLAARRGGDEFASDFIDEEKRLNAVLRWLVHEVRREPVFDLLMYDVPELEAPSPDIPGLTEGQVAAALAALIEEGLVEGEAHHVLGRREPRTFSKIYPTLTGINTIENLGGLTAESTPLLRALLEPRDWLELPSAHDPLELAPGLSLTPAEAFFRLRLLEAQGLIGYQREYESGGQASFMDVRTTSAGKRYLYEIGKGP